MDAENTAMAFNWLNATEVAKIGIELADEFASGRTAKPATHDVLREIIQRVDVEVRPLSLNFYKKAKFANSFKWRLLEHGVEKALADEATQELVLHLSTRAGGLTDGIKDDATALRPEVKSAKHLLARGDKSMARGAYAKALASYQDFVVLRPRNPTGLNNLGTALFVLGRYNEAELHYREAMRIQADYADAHSNLGTVLMLRGNYGEAEQTLRRALKLNPHLVQGRINLGLTLALSSRLRDARAHFEKALKHEPHHPDALFGMALIAKTEGRFDEAAALLERALQVNPGMPKALASLARLRKMTAGDGGWLENAEKVAAGGIPALEESELRFAIGKYYDDVGAFELAFQNYERANELLKPIAEPYDRDAHARFVEVMIRAHAPGTVAAKQGGSASMKPVFVVGMPRSGTSLVEQIIASHPAAKGAGELEFWSNAVHEYEDSILAGPLAGSARKKMADDYLSLLETKSGDVFRVVDKAPLNSDYLGVIHSVFPNARIVYMQRNPIDACLSCYFQNFVLSLNFARDLTDLADYYRQHERLMAHWRAVLPPGTILDVPYEELVADQEGWSRRILDFIGLEWDSTVLDFQDAQRPVVTASFWQVRQKMYKESVGRWRNYEKFIGPLLTLEHPAPARH
jgi:tetratricopeptide (TPR) repeat protein